ncbi:ORF6N domain-containing protein, partial [Candidatus Micrarchaeota archaeon]|nr:ORF6N domain-containing protein [Candidatus Micrarchaeota archaeon]
LDRDLAVLYGVETKNLNKAVKRNIERFPEDFAFQLTKEEWNSLGFQFGTLDTGKGSKRGKYTKYLPYAFTEQGVAMLSSVLRSPQAVKVNIEIMRAFIKLRQTLASHKELAKDLQEIKEFVLKNSSKNNREFQRIWRAIEKLTEKPNQRKIGFDLN